MSFSSGVFRTFGQRLFQSGCRVTGPPSCQIQKHVSSPGLCLSRPVIPSRCLSLSFVDQDKFKGFTRAKLRGALIDESENATLNIDALAEHLSEPTKEKGFQVFPDEMTEDQLFNGIKFKDLPQVTILCTYNHTKFWVQKGDGTKAFYTSPRLNGFLNAKKRTNVAGQITGQIVGQRMRNMNLRTCRVRVSGFNAARIASIEGIVQAGIQIVSISDITKVDWEWRVRAKKKKRQN